MWTIIGAIGSSLGAIIGAIALIVALKAYFQPARVALSAKMSAGFIINPSLSFNVYSIDVYNKGLRDVSISNISLRTGDKTMFLDLIPQGTIVEAFEPHFPVRLTQGTSVSFHLPYEKFNREIKRMVDDRQLNLKDKVRIAVKDGTDGTHLFKTKFKIESFCKLV